MKTFLRKFFSKTSPIVLRKKDDLEKALEKADYLTVVDQPFWTGKDFWVYENQVYITFPTLINKSIQSLSDIAKLYSALVWVYACVRTIGDAFLSLRFKFVRKVKLENYSRFEEVDFSPLDNVLDNPNESMSFCDLMEATGISLALLGDSYWEIVFDHRERPVKLYPLLPQNMKIHTNEKGISYYEYTVKYFDDNGDYRSVTTKFSPDEIAHFKAYNPLSEVHGISGLVPGIKTASIEMSSNDYLDSFFKNSAVPAGIIKIDGFLSEEAYTRFLKRWYALHGGSSKAHRVGILEKGADFKAISFSLRDNEVLNLKKLNREEILAIFRVPPGVLGIRESGNYATIQAERKIFWEDTILPKLEKIKGVINRKLVKSRSVKFDFDLDHIPALRENIEVRTRVARMLSDGGLITANEARRHFLNWQPIEGGDDLWRPANMLPVTSGRNPENERSGRKPGLDNTKPKSKTIDYNSLKDTWKLKLTDLLKEQFEKQKMNTYSALSVLLPFDLTDKDEYLSLEVQIRDAVSKGIFGTQDEMIDSLKEIFIDSVSHLGITTLHENGRYDLITEYAKQYKTISEYADDWAYILAVEVNSDTEKYLLDSLFSEELLEHVSYTKVMDQVNAVFEELLTDISNKQTRLLKIFNTEWNCMFNCARYLAFKVLGYKYKIWKTTSDNPRPSHAELAEQKIGIDEYFKVGDFKALFPSHWRLAASERINCQCYIVGGNA